jgi:hypothetical protein
LEGQYVLKDIVLLGASLVIAAATLGRAQSDSRANSAGVDAPAHANTHHRLNQEWENWNDGASR